MRTVKRYRLAIAILALDLIILAANPATGRAVFGATFQNLLQMAQFLPAIFLLLGLLDTWVPRQTVIATLGKRSGLLGIFLSIVLGAAAAGPLYAAFPVASTMLMKGASVFNVFVFLGAWANLKIPMSLFELSSMGPRFAFTRWALNVVGIVVIAIIMRRLFSDEEVAEMYARQKDLQAPQPGMKTAGSRAER